MFQPLRVYLVSSIALAASFLENPAVHAAETVTAEKNRLAEVAFLSQKDHGDPFNDVVLDVVFTTPKREQVRVPAYWSGGRTWRVRWNRRAGISAFDQRTL